MEGAYHDCIDPTPKLDHSDRFLLGLFTGLSGNLASDRDQDQDGDRGIIHLARSLGIETTGEGIETEAELKLLQELGCQLGQGFLFARAMSAKDIVHRYGD